MAFRQVLRSALRRARPFMYATSSMFVNFPPVNKPCPEEKLTLEPPNLKNLSYDYMIRQSTVDAVNSASQVLTVTYSAIEATSKEYRSLLIELIALLRETLSHEVCDAHWDMIVEMRSEVQDKKQIVTQLVGLMDYVHRMAVAAAETSYLAGMDNLSTTLCQRIDDALTKMMKEVEHNKKLEDEYSLIQQQSDKKDLLEDPPLEELPTQLLSTD